MSSSRLLRLKDSRALTSLRQGGTVSIRSSFPGKVGLKIIPQWRGDSLVSLEQATDSFPSAGVKVVQEKDLITSLGRAESHVSVNVFPKNEPLQFENSSGESIKELRNSGQDHSDSSQLVCLTAMIPEKSNICCDLPRGGSITIEGKVEGDAQLLTSDGDVSVSKLRGHEIKIVTMKACNSIHVSKLIEAENMLLSTPGRIRAKQIHGKDVTVVSHEENDPDYLKKDRLQNDTAYRLLDADDNGSCVDVSSLYVSRDGDVNVIVSRSQQKQNCEQAVRIESCHGHVNVEACVKKAEGDKIPVVELGSISGSCDVSVCIQNDEHGVLPGSISSKLLFNSLSSGAVSSVSSNAGDVYVALSSNASADLRLLSSSNIESFDVVDLLAQEDDPDLIATALNRLSSSFDGNLRHCRSESIHIESHSLIENSVLSALSKSSSALSFVHGRIGTAVEGQCLGQPLDKHGGGKIRLEGAAKQSLQNFAFDGKDETLLPLLIVATSGEIMVETFSWKDAISRRYGLGGEQ